MIKEIMACLKDEDLEITFRMDSGYFDEDILKTIESFGCTDWDENVFETWIKQSGLEHFYRSGICVNT